ncbi:hypothetical protein GW17_00051476 [Ensete ventricosum]|nr:hypothetical protein GW17_00051476 [Ensete ventricosum]
MASALLTIFISSSIGYADASFEILARRSRVLGHPSENSRSIVVLLSSGGVAPVDSETAEALTAIRSWGEGHERDMAGQSESQPSPAGILALQAANKELKLRANQELVTTVEHRAKELAEDVKKLRTELETLKNQ